MSLSKVDHPQRQENFQTGAYSDGIIAGGFLFVSGQASVDFNSEQFILADIETETQQTLLNIQAILEQAGASLQDVVKCTVHLADIQEFDRFNEVYARYFTGNKPARTTVQSVLAGGIRIEIDCIAKLPA
jgi:2-iminobutanoate/2-iminopropanoate deaminase